jgi:hypothetical protein
MDTDEHGLNREKNAEHAKNELTAACRAVVNEGGRTQRSQKAFDVHRVRLKAFYAVIGAVMFIFGMFVIYMFYARLRDIADELRKFRIAYEMAEDRKARVPTPTPPHADDDLRYLPKS